MSTDFATLQAKLRPLWERIRQFNDLEQTIVVIPSLSVDRRILEKFAELALLFEERMLFTLFLLRQPRARLVYVTSLPVDERAIDYYLSLLPGVIPSQAKKRLFMYSTGDAAPNPLSEKLLSRPDLLDEIRSLINDPDHAHLVPYITTEMERDLALALGIPMYGCDPQFLHFGTKSWSRRIFEDEEVRLPKGSHFLTDFESAVIAVADLKKSDPAIKEVVLKLDAGAGGTGNLVVPVDFEDAAVADVRKTIESLSPSPDFSAAEYIQAFNTSGGIVEEMVRGEEVRSPSVQLRITPLGEVQVLSTHDQLLGGPSGQSYSGCMFPSDPEYASLITEPAERIGQRLAREGVLGRFAVDFITVRDAAGWKEYAIEINLRKGGTTHPYLTLQFLTEGVYDKETGVFLTPRGEPRHLIATDHAHLSAPISIDDLFERAVENNLHFDNSRQTGVVFHMLGGLESLGLFGLTSVHDSREQAQGAFDKSIELLGAEA